LESIIIFALFAIASSVIQAVIKNSKQQNQSAKATQSVKPKVKTTIKAMNNANISMKQEVYQEGTQTEGLGPVEIQYPIEKPSNTTSSTPMESITSDELQRSIIMAEVLGKPRALKKAIR
jgi:Na+-translocating ferredoxin:NAD+ oxidoreductase RnfG subunit